MCVDLKVCVQLQPGVQLCSLGDWWCWAPPPAEGPPVIQGCSPGRCRLIGPFSSKSIYLSLNSGHFLKVVPSFVLFDVLAWSSHVQTIPQRAVWLQVFFSTKQQHIRPDSFNQLVSVFRKWIGQTVCFWLVGTKTCSHTALCGIVWTCLA